ncbi:hypothetical protein PG988_002851 [Apiospora saccharicola]
MEIDTQSKPEPECHHKEDQEQQQPLAGQQQPAEQKPAVHMDDEDEDQQGQSTWVAYLETERNRRFDPVDSSFMSIFRDLLRSNARSMLKHGGDEGLADFVHLVYNLIFELAPLLAHDSAQHVRLFELLVELRKLPPRSFKLNSFRRFFLSEAKLGANARGQMHYCEAWVNFSIFKARCVEAGILDQRTNPYGLPADQIVEGLETDPLPTAQAVRDCKVLIAAHYLAVAGEKFHERLILVPRRAFNNNTNTNTKAAAAIALHRGRARWSLWAARLEFLAQHGGLSEHVVETLQMARRRVVAIEPVLFPGMAMRR